jgi:hypothetical protein
VVIIIKHSKNKLPFQKKNSEFFPTNFSFLIGSAFIVLVFRREFKKLFLPSLPAVVFVLGKTAMECIQSQMSLSIVM